MLKRTKENKNKFILAIHSTNDYFGFGYKDLNIENVKNQLFIKKLDKDLSRNLISNLNEFLSHKSIDSIERISISIGPANFNASRQIVVCARTISQQINCSLDKYSSFYLMAKRIALKNQKIINNKTFWIYKKLKSRGIIAGKYNAKTKKNSYEKWDIEEIISPLLYKDFLNNERQFEAEYKIKDELKQLLELSLDNYKNLISNHWKNVLPIYPIDPVD